MDQNPLQVYPAVTSVTSKEAAALVEEEVDSLLQKGVVVVAAPCADQFISRLFLVQKKDKSFRPVINLKPLNTYIQKEHFKMEGANMIKDLLQAGDWMCSLDLKEQSTNPSHRLYQYRGSDSWGS